jgi:hypothetical protein
MNSLPHRGRVGERGSNKQRLLLIYIPSSWPSPGGRRNTTFYIQDNHRYRVFPCLPFHRTKVRASHEGEGFTDPLSTLKALKPVATDVAPTGVDCCQGILVVVRASFEAIARVQALAVMPVALKAVVLPRGAGRVHHSSVGLR